MMIQIYKERYTRSGTGQQVGISSETNVVGEEKEEEGTQTYKISVTVQKNKNLITTELRAGPSMCSQNL